LRRHLFALITRVGMRITSGMARAATRCHALPRAAALYRAMQCTPEGAVRGKLAGRAWRGPNKENGNGPSAWGRSRTGRVSCGALTRERACWRALEARTDEHLTLQECSQRALVVAIAPLIARSCIHTGRLLYEVREIRQIDVDRELWVAIAIERLDDEPVL